MELSIRPKSLWQSRWIKKSLFSKKCQLIHVSRTRLNLVWKNPLGFNKSLKIQPVKKMKRLGSKSLSYPHHRRISLIFQRNQEKKKACELIFCSQECVWLSIKLIGKLKETMKWRHTSIQSLNSRTFKKEGGLRLRRGIPKNLRLSKCFSLPLIILKLRFLCQASLKWKSMYSCKCWLSPIWSTAITTLKV